MSVQVGSSCEDNITWHFLHSCMLAHSTALLSEELRCRRALENLPKEGMAQAEQEGRVVCHKEMGAALRGEYIEPQ